MIVKYNEKIHEAGIDEAGRGCLAGPVYAAAVILPDDFDVSILDDSKKLSEKKRIYLRPIIEEKAIAYAVAMADNREIDKLNILKATFIAMHRAIDNLKQKPEFLLIDGNHFAPYPKIPHKCIIGGDGKYGAIAAASILAKTYRDEYMIKLHEEHPEYNWKKNKAYGTKEHRLAIQKYGLTKYHRKTFTMSELQLSIDFDI